VKNKNQQLVDAVRCLLGASIEPLSEYQLLKLLKDQGWDLPTSASDSLALFTSHFLLFNALYVLQDEYWCEQRYLEISVLKIALHEAVKPSEINRSSTSLLYSNAHSLRAYYLYLVDDERAEALAIFSLPATTSYSEIKKTYRRLAMRNHPDRGGDAHAFQLLNHAFGILQRLYDL
jgi:DnaJ-domain-containing protein 1